MKSNLIFNRDVLRKSSFAEKSYLYELYEEVKDFTYKCPTPIIAEWDESYHKIIFKIGKNTKSYKVSSFVSPRDFITSVEFWSCTYYPKYYVEEKVLTRLDTEEKFKAITEENLTLEESLNKVKVTSYIERGMIVRIFLPDDKFTILVNGKRHIRLSGTIHKPMPLSVFLKELRYLYVGEDKYEYFKKVKAFIENNSTIENKDVKDKDIDISYTGKRLDNFIQINKRQLCNSEIFDLSPVMVKIGKFTIIFESEEKKKETLLKIDMFKEKRNLKRSLMANVE